MSNELKELAKMSDIEREYYSELPNDAAEKAINDMNNFRHIISSVTESLVPFNLDPHEIRDQVISALLQFYAKN